jgi:O-antigen/teichoic acid export membrane protein
MVIGCLLFMGIIINKQNLLMMINKKEYSEHFNLFIVIGLSCLVDITGGLNTYIISTSHKYRLISIGVFISSMFCIGLTYLLIPIYSGLGAAIAYLVTISIFNFCNWFYIKYRFKMQPFNYKHLLVIVITVVSYYIGNYFWRMPNLYLDVIVRSGITALFYGLLTYFFHISVDLNEKVDSTILRIKVLVK